jgi:hypothetical protein
MMRSEARGCEELAGQLPSGEEAIIGCPAPYFVLESQMTGEHTTMSLEIGWFSFDGPYDDESGLPDEAGVFAVLSQEEGGKYNLLDVDDGFNLRESALGHQRRECWQKEAGGPLRFLAYPLPDDTPEAREKIVKEVRMQYVMACSPSETPTRGWWRPDEQ